MQHGIDEALGASTSEAVARAIRVAIQRNRTRVLTGRDTKALDLLVRTLPAGYVKLLHRRLNEFMAKSLGEPS